jgi:hypothetical protein
VAPIETVVEFERSLTRDAVSSCCSSRDGLLSLSSKRSSSFRGATNMPTLGPISDSFVTYLAGKIGRRSQQDNVLRPVCAIFGTKSKNLISLSGIHIGALRLKSDDTSEDAGFLGLPQESFSAIPTRGVFRSGM